MVNTFQNFIAGNKARAGRKALRKKALHGLSVCTSVVILLIIAHLTQASAFDTIKITALKDQSPDLDGNNVKIAVICRSMTYDQGLPLNDYRPFADHNCFKNANLNFHDANNLPAKVSSHSTAICSILFGQDPNVSDPNLAISQYQGIAPKAGAQIYEFWHFLTEYVYTNTPPDADVISVSCGEQFQDWWTTGIESLASNFGQTIVAGIGNGSKFSDPLLYPGASSNVIGVGVIDSIVSDDWQLKLDNFTLPHSQHSSTGPTQQNTCKPDIVAPGNFLTADANTPDLYSPAGDFSSYATPAVAGTAALLIQQAKQNPDYDLALSTEAGNCVIKAILLNSATKLPFWHKGQLTKDDDHTTPLDYTQGAGMLNAQRAYQTLTAGPFLPGDVNSIGWDLNFLDINISEKSYYFTITNPADDFITATLSWNRYYENQYPFARLSQYDTDLRIQLWAIDPNNAQNNYLLDYCDSNTDNLEHLYSRLDPNYTNYQLTISFSPNSQHAENINQPFAVAWDTAEQIDTNNILFYDLNCNGQVTLEDSMLLVKNWLQNELSPEKYTIGDINNDSLINMHDINILNKYKNQYQP